MQRYSKAFQNLTGCSKIAKASKDSQSKVIYWVICHLYCLLRYPGCSRCLWVSLGPTPFSWCYLEEIIHWDGRGDFCKTVACLDCLARRSTSPQAPEYCCCKCFLPDLVCQSCCVKWHRTHPLHNIEASPFQLLQTYFSSHHYFNWRNGPVLTSSRCL